MEAPCPFFKDNKCSVYELRPMICKAYPIIITEIKDSLYWYKRSECPEAKNLTGIELNEAIFTAFHGNYTARIVAQNMPLKQRNKLRLYQIRLFQKDNEERIDVPAKRLSEKTVHDFINHINKQYAQSLQEMKKLIDLKMKKRTDQIVRGDKN